MRGLAAATALIRLSWSPGRARLGRSSPSVSASLAKTIGTCTRRASETAESIASLVSWIVALGCAGTCENQLKVKVDLLPACSPTVAVAVSVVFHPSIPELEISVDPFIPRNASP